DWQPLRLNMPATSIRDLIVKGDDLAVATHGRGFWILDDIEPLREVTDALVGEDVHLFTPQTALRIRWNTNSDTPMPPDEPRGEDPPDGAVIDYFLGATTTDVTLEILDREGKLVRLTAGRRSLTRQLTVRMDPRVNTPDAALRQQLALSLRLAEALDRNTRLLHQIRRLRKDRPDDAALAALEGPAEERKPLAEEP